MRKHFITLACTLACNALVHAQDYAVESWNADSTIVTLRIDSNTKLRLHRDPQQTAERYDASTAYTTIRIFQTNEALSLGTHNLGTVAIPTDVYPDLYDGKTLKLYKPLLIGTFTYESKGNGVRTVPIIREY